MASSEQQQALLALRPSQVAPSRRNKGKGGTNAAAGGPNHPQSNRSRGRKGLPAGNAATPNSQEQDTSLNKTPAKATRRRRGKNAKNDNTPASPAPQETATEETAPQETAENANSKNQAKKKNNRARKKKQKQQYPWRASVPEEAVDPITLDHLNQLKYPPFALCAEEPFEPLFAWPPSSSDKNEVTNGIPKETEEERQRRLIAEQWGKHVEVQETEEDKKIPPRKRNEERHYNLYDGQALAYYMVSQLQFIDPLNRRDLTRDELINLDHYLQRHGFTDLNVTEAYDAKGITLSSAGSAANTATGRAAILQQVASLMLRALFAGTSVTAAAAAALPPRQSNNTSRLSNTLTNQYLAHNENQQARPAQQRQPIQEADDWGISGTEGFLVVDADRNPGLRSTAMEFVPNTLYSASHIAGRYGRQALVQAHDFPSLAPRASAPTDPPRQQQPQVEQPKLASKTLSRIGNAVRKRDPEELQRQFEAREEARRRAMMTNLTFGSNHHLAQLNSEDSIIPSQIVTATTTEGQLERNRTLAEALSVTPATARTTFNSGWARPSGSDDEFGNELFNTIYADSLLQKCREKIDILLKVERKWFRFLKDDTAASMPLNRMDRPTRALVHEYAAYWKLHTESFDPEPHRYIHCVKLRDTSAPTPLLSEAVRLRLPGSSDHPSQQTAGQNTSGWGLTVLPGRAPLSLKPRSTPFEVDLDTIRPGISLGGAPSRSMTQEQETSRFASLSGGERPKLDLQKRTRPLELPPVPMQQNGLFDASEEILLQKQRAQERERKEREVAQRKQRILEAAFASDDESNDGDDSSVWEEPEALYPGYDDEEE
jgi:hypothetical protein